MKLRKWTVFLLFLANLLGCHGEKPPRPSENSILAEVSVQKDGAKTTAKFMFYQDISEVVDGKEIKGFGKNPVVVDFPKINGLAMKEIVNKDAPKMYQAEIEKAAQDYTVTFSRKDGEYQSIIHLDPNDSGQPVKAEFKRKPG